MIVSHEDTLHKEQELQHNVQNATARTFRNTREGSMMKVKIQCRCVRCQVVKDYKLKKGRLAVDLPENESGMNASGKREMTASTEGLWRANGHGSQLYLSPLKEQRFGSVAAASVDDCSTWYCTLFGRSRVTRSCCPINNL